MRQIHSADHGFDAVGWQQERMQLQVAERQAEVGRKSEAQALHFLYKEDEIMSFGKNLQMLRKKNQLSQEGLAEMLGVSRQAVSKWELGEGYPEVDKLLILSKKLNVSNDTLFMYSFMASKSSCKSA